ncbi:MAG TPA: DNA 3-methyladenine glycosylase 2, partial [Actinomycetota bacterium]
MSADRRSVRVRLDHGSPLADGHLLGFLGSRAIQGCEVVEGRRYTRSMRLSTGSPAVVQLEPDPSEPFVTMWMRGSGDPGSVERAVRRLLDLDADPGAIDATLRADPLLRPLVRSAPGLRLPGAVDGFEIVVRAVVGQQVSVAGARTTLGRIAERFGEPLPEPLGTVVRTF